MASLPNGSYPCEEEMPCTPHDIAFLRYALPGTLGKFRTEEAVARILSFSQQLDRWVGVSWPELRDTMRQDLETARQIEEVRGRNRAREISIAAEVRHYRVMCWLTAGIHAFFHNKPVATMEPVPEVALPFSGIYVFGPEHVVNGIHDLIERGLIRQVIRDGTDVFFPTPALVTRIMESQGLS